MAPNKRKHEGSDEPEAKRYLVAETKKLPLHFTDLNEDVLEKIFSYLNANDLVNVVKYDEVLLSSSRRAFQRKYKNDYIRLPLDTQRVPYYKKNAELLRYFGKNISKLEINMIDVNPIDQRIFHLIVTMCRDTLVEMKLWYPTTKLKINKPFTKLKSLVIYDGTADQSMYQFHKWFPNLETLSYDCVEDIASTLNMGQKIASLKCFSLDFSDEDYGGFSIHMDDLNRFIQFNPQLNEVRLTLADFNIGTVRTGHSFTSISSLDDIIPVKLTVKLNIPFDDGSTEYSEALAHLKIPNDRIEHLDLTTVLLTTQVLSYIAKCTNLKTLKLAIKVSLWDDFDPFNEPIWKNSAKHAPLSHLEIRMDCYFRSNEDYYEFGLAAIRPYLKQHKTIQTITVKYTRLWGKENDKTFDIDCLRAKINLKIWSFTRELSENGISFTLIKI